MHITGTTSPAEAQKIANEHNRPGDWSQWCGSSLRNNVVDTKVPTDWKVGEFDEQTGQWKRTPPKTSNGRRHWAANLWQRGCRQWQGVHPHRNGAAIERYPAEVDLGVLLCLDEKDGSFLWQDSNEKLPTGRVNDWPQLGVCSSALVDGNRVYYVSNRGELRCLDTEGFRDGKNDGTVTNEKELAQKKTADAEWDEQHEADVVWVFNIMQELGVSQHNMANCSVTMSGDCLFLCTSNGVDVDHLISRLRTHPVSAQLTNATAKCCGLIIHPEIMCCTAMVVAGLCCDRRSAAGHFWRR